MRLKRCPFCGGKPKHIEYTKGVSHTIWCPGCGVETNDPRSKKEAYALWNRRSSELSGISGELDLISEGDEG